MIEWNIGNATDQRTRYEDDLDPGLLTAAYLWLVLANWSRHLRITA